MFLCEFVCSFVTHLRYGRVFNKNVKVCSWLNACIIIITPVLFIGHSHPAAANDAFQIIGPVRVGVLHCVCQFQYPIGNLLSGKLQSVLSSNTSLGALTRINGRHVF